MTPKAARTLLSPKEMEKKILSHYEQVRPRENSATSTFVANLTGNDNANVIGRQASDSCSYSYSQSLQSHSRKKTPFTPNERDKDSPRDKASSHWKSKMGFLKNKKPKKAKKDNHSPKKRNSKSKSNKSPFNDEDHTTDDDMKRDNVC